MPQLAEPGAETEWSSGVDVGLVESVGGVHSPVAIDGDSRELIRATTPDLVVVVTEAGLGTIDAVRLATDALAPLPTVVVLNRFGPADDLHRRNTRGSASHTQAHKIEMADRPMPNLPSVCKSSASSRPRFGSTPPPSEMSLSTDHRRA